MNYIEKILNDFEDDFGPSATVQESRPMFNNGERLGFRKAGEVNPLTTKQKKLIDSFEEKTGLKYDDLSRQQQYRIRTNPKAGSLQIPLTEKEKTKIKKFETKTGLKYEDQSSAKKFSVRKDLVKYSNKLSVDDPKRLKEIKKYIKDFKKENKTLPTKNEVRQYFQKTTGSDVAKPLAFLTEKKEINLPSGFGSSSLKVVDNDVKKLLSNNTIKKILDKGKFPTDSQIQSVLKVDRTIAETRSIDLANTLTGDRKIRLFQTPNKYKKLATNYLKEQEKVGSSFINPKIKRARNYYEKGLTKLLDLPQNVARIRKDIIKKMQNIIPELKGVLAVDEIAGITTSMRRGSGPYAVFGQIIGSDFNTETKGRGIDKDKGILEKQLVKLDKNDPKRVELQKRYNTAVTEFENKANVDNPAKKVKGLKVSYEPPSKTIKNKKIYNQYKDLFDTHYKKYGYSFEVPADRDSLVDISKKLDNKSFQGIVKNRFKNLIGKGGKVGALVGLGTLAGTGFALADESLAADGKSLLPEAAAGTAAAGTAFKYRKPITKVAKKVIPKILAPLGIGLEGYFAKQGYDQGRTIPEIAAAPFMLEGFVSDAQERLRMSPAERQALNKQQIAQDFSGMDSDFATPYIKGSNEVNVDASRLRAQREEALARARRAQQRQGIMTQGLASGGVASGPAPQSGPNSQGLQGLFNRVKNY
jgi:hypothetical protein